MNANMFIKMYCMSQTKSELNNWLILQSNKHLCSLITLIHSCGANLNSHSQMWWFACIAIYSDSISAVMFVMRNQHGGYGHFLPGNANAKTLTNWFPFFKKKNAASFILSCFVSFNFFCGIRQSNSSVVIASTAVFHADLHLNRAEEC